MAAAEGIEARSTRLVRFSAQSLRHGSGRRGSRIGIAPGHCRLRPDANLSEKKPVQTPSIGGALSLERFDEGSMTSIPYPRVKDNEQKASVTSSGYRLASDPKANQSKRCNQRLASPKPFPSLTGKPVCLVCESERALCPNLISVVYFSSKAGSRQRDITSLPIYGYQANLSSRRSNASGDPHRKTNGLQIERKPLDLSHRAALA